LWVYNRNGAYRSKARRRPVRVAAASGRETGGLDIAMAFQAVLADRRIARVHSMFMVHR